MRVIAKVAISSCHCSSNSQQQQQLAATAAKRSSSNSIKFLAWWAFEFFACCFAEFFSHSGKFGFPKCLFFFWFLSSDFLGIFFLVFVLVIMSVGLVLNNWMERFNCTTRSNWIDWVVFAVESETGRDQKPELWIHVGGLVLFSVFRLSVFFFLFLFLVFSCDKLPHRPKSNPIDSSNLRPTKHHWPTDLAKLKPLSRCWLCNQLTQSIRKREREPQKKQKKKQK